MAQLYKFVKPTWTVNNKNIKLAKNLAPGAEGREIDVIKKFPWTLTPFNSPARTETPYIKLKEFYLLDSYINQLLQSYNLSTITPPGIVTDALGVLTNLGVIKNISKSKQLYEGLYDHVNETGFEYKLPYFQGGQTNINNWSQKSTYDTIVYYQQKLAPFTVAEEYLQSVPSVPGAPMDPLRAALTMYAGVPQWAVDAFGTDYINGSWSDWANAAAAWGKLFAASAARTAAGLVPGGSEALSMYESGARMYVQARRMAELVNIALKSPMGSTDSDPVIDKPTLWTTSQPRVFTVAFPLFNTSLFGDYDEEKTIIRNWELCYLLTYQNLYNKRNLYTGIPPVFYEIEIPGIHYTKAGYVNNLNIVNVGNVRRLKLPIGSNGEEREVNVPDGYFITMTLVDFFMPSKNFLNTINNSDARNKVKAFYENPADTSTTPPPTPGGGGIPGTSIIPGLGPVVPFGP